jgi:archaellin
LIAFVVVGSVFAYTVMTAGIYSSQKTTEAVNAAIEEVRPSVRSTGNILAYRGEVDTDGVTTSNDSGVMAITRITMELRTAINGVPIDLTPPYQINPVDGSLEPSGLTNTLVVDYLSTGILLQNIAWTVAFVGAADEDFSLETAERATLTAWLVQYDYDNDDGLYYQLGAGVEDPFMDDASELLGRYTPFSLEVSPVRGAPFQIERVTQQSTNPITNLH